MIILSSLKKDITNKEILSLVESIESNSSIIDKDGHFNQLLPALTTMHPNDNFLTKVSKVYENISANKLSYLRDVLESDEMEEGQKAYIAELVNTVGEKNAAAGVMNLLLEDKEISKQANDIYNKCKSLTSETGSCYKLVMEAISVSTNEDILYHLYTALSLPEVTAQSYIINNLRKYSYDSNIKTLIEGVNILNGNKLDHVVGSWSVENGNLVYTKLTPVSESKAGSVFSVGDSYYKQKGQNCISYEKVEDKASDVMSALVCRTDNGNKSLNGVFEGISVEISENSFKLDGQEVDYIDDVINVHRSMGVSSHTLSKIKTVYENRNRIKELNTVLVVESLDGSRRMEIVKLGNKLDVHNFENGVYEGRFEFTASEVNSILEELGVKTNFLSKELGAVLESKKEKEKRINLIKESIEHIQSGIDKILEAEEQGITSDELTSTKNSLEDEKKALMIKLSSEENSKTDDIVEKLSDKVLFFVNKIKDDIDSQVELSKEYTTDEYSMENGISVKIMIKGENVRTYEDINKSLYLSVDSKNKDVDSKITDDIKKNIVEVMSSTSVENFEDWKRALRSVLSTISMIGTEEPKEEPETKPEPVAQ